METSFSQQQQQRSDPQDPRLRAANLLSPSPAAPATSLNVTATTTRHSHSNTQGSNRAPGMLTIKEQSPSEQVMPANRAPSSEPLGRPQQTLRTLQSKFQLSERPKAQIEHLPDSSPQRPTNEQQLQRDPHPQLQLHPQPEPESQHAPEQQPRQERTWTELDCQDSRAMTELQVRDINHLLREMCLLDQDRSDPPQFKDDNNPTGIEIQALLLFYKENFRKCCHLKATLHIRFTRIEDSIRKIATFDRTFLEKACKQLQERKEHTMLMLGNEMNGLRNDIESLTEILAYMTDFDKSQEEQARLERIAKLRTAIRWNPAIPEHVCLHEIFGLEDIPVFKGTDDIDYGEIKLRDFEEAPSLNFDIPIIVAESKLLHRLIGRFFSFISEFGMFYTGKLGILFNHIAWRYIAESLSLWQPEVRGRYTDYIIKIPKRDRSWNQAKTALRKAIGLDMLRPHLIREILLMTPEPSEEFVFFAGRMIPLLEAVNISDTESSIVILSLVNLLSDCGLQVVLNEFGSLDTIPSLREFLVFLSITPEALRGPRTDRTHLFLLRYGGSTGATMVRKAIQAQEARRDDCINDALAASSGHKDTLSASSSSVNPPPTSTPIDHVSYNPTPRQQKRSHFLDSGEINSPVGTSSQHLDYDDYNDSTAYASPNSTPPRPPTRNNKKHKTNTKTNTNNNCNAPANSNNSRKKREILTPCSYTPKCRAMPYKHEALECFVFLAELRARKSAAYEKESSFSP